MVQVLMLCCKCCCVTSVDIVLRALMLCYECGCCVTSVDVVLQVLMLCYKC